MFTIALINNMKSVKLVRYWLHINIVTWIYIFYLAQQKKKKKKVTEHVNVLGPERACCWYSACCKAFFGQVQGWLLRTWPSLKSRSRCIGFFFFFFFLSAKGHSALYIHVSHPFPRYIQSHHVQSCLCRTRCSSARRVQTTATSTSVKPDVVSVCHPSILPQLLTSSVHNCHWDVSLIRAVMSSCDYVTGSWCRVCVRVSFFKVLVVKRPRL